MNRRFVAAGLAAAALFTFVACSSDDSSGGILQPDDTAEITVPDGGGVTLPDNATIPSIPGVSQGCTEILNAMLGSAILVTGEGDLDQAQAALDSLVDAVPEDLKDDAVIYAEVYGALFAAIADNGGDFTSAMTNPDVQAVIQRLEDPDVQAAVENISDYVDTQCNDA